MQLYKAKIFCSECSNHHIGPAMSDEEEAIQFLWIEHMETWGHWPEGAAETWTVESEKPGKKFKGVGRR